MGSVESAIQSKIIEQRAASVSAEKKGVSMGLVERECRGVVLEAAALHAHAHIHPTWFEHASIVFCNGSFMNGLLCHALL